MRSNYRDKDMPRYDLNIAIFDTLRYIVPSLIDSLMHPQSSSKGHNRSVSVTVTVTIMISAATDKVIDHRITTAVTASSG